MTGIKSGYGEKQSWFLIAIRGTGKDCHSPDLRQWGQEEGALGISDVQDLGKASTSTGLCCTTLPSSVKWLNDHGFT